MLLGQGGGAGFAGRHGRDTLSYVAQMRRWLPAPVGGILWFGVDDAASTVYMPMYCGITRVPESLAEGNVEWSLRREPKARNLGKPDEVVAKVVAIIEEARGKR